MQETEEKMLKRLALDLTAVRARIRVSTDKSMDR
jgi:hypothetical protein